jgi:hypothetical protein
MNNYKSTIIYYTSNREHPDFEARIQENLLKVAGDLPIISISQKPVALGENICVGEQPACYSNSFQQLLIGLKEAKTEFCIAAESDCLYPPEYFSFIPPTNDNVYRYTNIWIHFDGRRKFWKKHYVEGAQMCDRKYWIKSIERVLNGHTGWEPIPNPLPLIFTSGDKYFWTGTNPVLYFKTRRGIGFKTGYVRDVPPVTSLPYWGTAEFIENVYLRDNI